METDSKINHKPRTLAIIPARGGSKRLPRKNIMPLGGKPLLAYTIEAALKSGCFQNIILSSDDEAILAVGAAYDGVEAQQRPAHLAQDSTKAIEVVSALIDQPDLAGKYDALVMLPPTSPFRGAGDIRAALALLTPEVDTVVSISPYDFSPHMGVTLADDTNRLVLPEALLAGKTQMQEYAKAYHPNGSIYCSWWQSFDKYRAFYAGTVRGYIMDGYNALDIDEERDLLYAQFLLEKGLVRVED